MHVWDHYVWEALFVPTLCSIFSLFFLHLFLFGCNIFAWRKTRINYSFIFELCPTKELKYRDVFLICTSSMAAVVGVLFVHLLLVEKGYSYTQVQAIPGLLFLVAFDYITMSQNQYWNHFSWTSTSIIISLAGFHCSPDLSLQRDLQVKSLPVAICDKKHRVIASV